MNSPLKQELKERVWDVSGGAELAEQLTLVGAPHQWPHGPFWSPGPFHSMLRVALGLSGYECDGTHGWGSQASGAHGLCAGSPGGVPRWGCVWKC